MFSENFNRKVAMGLTGENSPDVRDEMNAKKNLEQKKKEEFVTQKSFVSNFTKIFIGDLDTKMKFTFQMYDFDNDGWITPEDIRIMMSYMPFNRNIQIQNVQLLLDDRGFDSLSSGMHSPSSKTMSMIKERKKQREGLYEDEEGRNMNYNDRISD